MINKCLSGYFILTCYLPLAWQRLQIARIFTELSVVLFFFIFCTSAPIISTNNQYLKWCAILFFLFHRFVIILSLNSFGSRCGHSWKLYKFFVFYTFVVKCHSRIWEYTSLGKKSLFYSVGNIISASQMFLLAVCWILRFIKQFVTSAYSSGWRNVGHFMRWNLLIGPLLMRI